jgi:hypothetical protein
LVALKRLELIDIDQVVLDEIDVTPIASNLPTVDQEESDCDEEESDDEDNCLDDEQRERASNNEDQRGRLSDTIRSEIEIEAWTIESETHAAPGITMAEYKRLIIGGFEEASRETVTGIVEAYGLNHKTVINELITLSKGYLKMHLDNTLEDWKNHAHVSEEYWNLIRDFFPAIADLLTVNFQARSITGTPVEQTFCLAATQVRANQSADTNAKNMNHASSVKGAITREMRAFVDSHGSNNKRRRKHLYRGTKSQCTYLRNLRDYGEKISASVKVDGQIKVPTVVQIRDKGKRILELKHSLPHTKSEMLANAPRNVVKIGGDALSQAVKNSSLAKMNSWTNMPEPEKDIYEDAARKMSAFGFEEDAQELFRSRLRNVRQY